MIALVLSLAGSAVFTLWLGKKVSKATPHPAGETYYVAAAQNLQAGDVLTAASLKLVSWPTTVPLDGAFPKPDALNGRIVLYPVAAGEPINERQLAAAGSSAGLAMKIPNGMRAISLRSDQVVGVAGFLLPGTHVDVLVNFRVQNTPDTITLTVLQDAQVIASGQKTEPDPQGKPTTADVVTLLVTPGDAEKAVEASSQGSVHFVLRNGGDHAKVPAMPIQTASLSGELLPPAANLPIAPVAHRAEVAAREPVHAPKPYVVEMIYGGDKPESGK